MPGPLLLNPPKTYFAKFGGLGIFIGGFFLILSVGILGWFGEGIFQNLIHQNFPFQAAVVEILTPEPEKGAFFEAESEEEEENEEDDDEEEAIKTEPEEESFPQTLDSLALETSLIAVQDQIDDITEKIDILSQEINDLIEESQLSKAISEIEEEKNEKEEDEEDEEEKEGEEEIGQEVGQEPCEIISGAQPTKNTIIINEIAWMGGFSSSNDEWIELKNISNLPIDLAGWQLLDKGNQIKIIFPKGAKLLLGGFYLLERTDDNSVPGLLADSIYTGALNDKDEALYLFDQNCQLQDKVEAEPDWQAGSKSEKRTMERKTDFGWQASLNPGGTPRRENSSGYIETPPATGGGAPPPIPEPIFCSQENLAESLHWPIILNEVAWAGTLTDWRDEWLELKNISEEDVLIDGWQILDKDAQIKIILSGTVPSKEFYLLERTNDDSVPNILADEIYTGNLEDNDEILRLFDQNCSLIDEILADSEWPAGSKEERRSMERKETLDWQTYFGEGENGIMGTPKKENSQSPEVKDETPPLVAFDNISPLQINPEFIIFWQGQDPEDTAPPSGIEGFSFRYSEDKENWNYFPLENEYTQETQYNFRGENEKTYYFQIKAKDKAGNESGWVEIVIEINNLPVVINEIAWMGTLESYNNEWIELYNNTNLDINLTGWTLKAEDGVPEIILSRTVLGKGFYLLERTDDSTLPDILADQTYTGALGNTGENLELYNLDNYLIDRVICKEDEVGQCQEWLAGNNETKQTMERKNPNLPGDRTDNWANSQEPGGTPRAQNSQ